MPTFVSVAAAVDERASFRLCDTPAPVVNTTTEVAVLPPTEPRHCERVSHPQQSQSPQSLPPAPKEASTQGQLTEIFLDLPPPPSDISFALVSCAPRHKHGKRKTFVDHSKSVVYDPLTTSKQTKSMLRINAKRISSSSTGRVNHTSNTIASIGVKKRNWRNSRRVFPQSPLLVVFRQLTSPSYSTMLAVISLCLMTG